jgi:Tfp pilus assembly protein PilN
MAQNLTTGIVQVLDNSPESINAAFAQILEQLDHLRGLRGRTLLYDEAGVSSPTQGSSAARLEDLQALLSDPADPFAAAQRVHASQDDQAFFGELEETLLLLLTARHGPTATQVYYAEGVETMNLAQSLAQIGLV